MHFAKSYAPHISIALAIASLVVAVLILVPRQANCADECVYVATPDMPFSLGPAEVVDGGIIHDTQPTFTFSLSDPDEGELVRYKIEIAQADGGVIRLVTQYTSDLMPQGSATFTVGQVAGTGTYTAGEEGQTLIYGTYGWSVSAIDSTGLDSGYTIANSDSYAFALMRTPVAIVEATPVETPTTDQTPNYGFISSEAGTISYGGACTSSTTRATAGPNTITFNTLSGGTYSDCTIMVTADDEHESNVLVISSFEVSAPTPPVVSAPSPAPHRTGSWTLVEIIPTEDIPQKETPPEEAPQETVVDEPLPTPSEEASPVARFIFTKTLALKDEHPDVKELQNYLNTHGFVLGTSGPGSPGNETTYFGKLTAQALARLQEAHAAEILVPLGLTKGTGAFGILTMQFINSH